MNKPRVSAEEYIQFLVASPAAVSGTEAARVHAGPVVALRNSYIPFPLFWLPTNACCPRKPEC